jgi:hypothetical protein
MGDILKSYDELEATKWLEGDLLAYVKTCKASYDGDGQILT